MNEKTPLLECLGLTKRFGGITALEHMTLTLNPGEIVALLGDNGAGKSTFLKLLAGALTPDEGEIRKRGAHLNLTSPKKAQECGIEAVWQTLALASDLDASANLFLGRELTYLPGLRRFAPLRTRDMRSKAAEMLGDMGIDLLGRERTPVGRLSGGQVQAIAIARAAGWAREVLLLDEPTAALGVHQSEIVLSLCRKLRATGLSLVIITHSVRDALAVADRIVIMRHGRKEFDGPRAALSEARVVEMILTATPNGDVAPSPANPPGKETHG
jgi:simple sugar transport system ATP-binding protein